MTRHVTIRRSKLFAAVHVTLLGSVTLAGCSVGSREGMEVPAAGTEGSFSATLELEPGTSLDSITYEITGPSAFSESGSVELCDSTSLSSLIDPIPAGSGFTVVFTGTASSGAECAGSARFDVVAGRTTPVPVALRCQVARRSGGVDPEDSRNACPVVDRVVASPADAPVGEALKLVVEAHDLDHGPSPLTYRWETDLGTLSEASAPDATLTCTTTGTAHVTISVSDGDPTRSCADGRGVTVLCTPGTSTGPSRALLSRAVVRASRR